MSEEGFGVVEEVARERDVLDLFVSDAADGGAVEAEDVGAGQSHQDGRVRGDDELRVLLGHPLEHREEGELALRRERRLRLVEQVEAAGDEARLEEAEEALAVRALVWLTRRVKLKKSSARRKKPRCVRFVHASLSCAARARAGASVLSARTSS